MDDDAARPGQQCRHDKADALAGTGRREAQHMLRPIVAEIVAVQPAQHHAIRAEQSGRLHLLGRGPTRRTVGGDVLGLTRADDRQGDGDGDGEETARSRDDRSFDEDRGRIGIVGVPPPEKGRRIVERPAAQLEPWCAKLPLKSEPPRRPLGRAPDRRQHDDDDDGDLAPEDTASRHTGSNRQKRRSRSENRRFHDRQQERTASVLPDTMA